jgi:TolB-like protein/Flp pilus assembly protein TadD
LQTLKNISQPVHVFRLADLVAQPTPANAPATERPSIAVLPFSNMSGDLDQEYFSDGITEDIITELSRFRSLFVIARNSSFQFKGKSLDVKRIGRELGVQYLIEGSIRRAGDRLRATAQLIETNSGGHVWAERYDRDARDIFELQEELAHAVAATVGARIDIAGRERSTRLSAAGLKGYDLHLRAKASYLKFTKESNQIARSLWWGAIKLDPLIAVTTAHYANCCHIDYFSDWVQDVDGSLQTALEFARRAVSLDENDPTAQWIFGSALAGARNYEEARFHAEKAIDLNPNDSEARGMYGNLLTYVGEPEKALEQLALAKRQNPFDPAWAAWVRVIAFFAARRYQDAILAFSEVHAPNCEVMLYCAASLAQLDRREKARAKLQEALRIAKTDMAHFPDQDPQAWMLYLYRANPFRNQSDFDHLVDGLRRAGLGV